MTKTLRLSDVKPEVPHLYKNELLRFPKFSGQFADSQFSPKTQTLNTSIRFFIQTISPLF